MKTVKALLALICLSLCWWQTSASQQVPVVVKDVEVLEGKEVRITYELTEDADEEYQVEAYLFSEKDQTANRKLTALGGDLAGKIAGGIRRIIWDYQADYPNAVAGDAYRIRLVINKMSSGSSWYWYAGASAVAVGTAAVVLLGKGTDGPPPPIPQIPMPPARP